MPEGHTVHRLARTFDALFRGEALAVSSPQGRFAPGAARIDGFVLAGAEAFGKQMFLRFDDGRRATAPRWLRVHLGLYGSWTFTSDGSSDVAHAIGAPRKRIAETETIGPLPTAAERAAAFPPPPRGQVRARLLGTHAVADLTGPTACEVISGDEMTTVLERLGPDPIRADANEQQFADAVRRSRSPIATLLMDQAIVAGVGNIYRAEALYRARLAPLTPGRSVPAPVVHELWEDLVVLMHDGVRVGRIVTTLPQDRGTVDDDVDADGRLRPPRPGAARQNNDDEPGVVPRSESFYVYQRDGLPCRVCGTSIALRLLGGRKLYWCPGCQA